MSYLTISDREIDNINNLIYIIRSECDPEDIIHVGLFYYIYNFEDVHEIKNIYFYNCTFKIGECCKIQFRHCMFNYCSFENCNINVIDFTDSSLTNIKSSDSVFNTIYIDLPPDAFDITRYDLFRKPFIYKPVSIMESVKSVFCNVDFSGIKYKNFYTVDIGGDCEINILYYLLENNLLRISIPANLPPIGESIIGYKVAHYKYPGCIGYGGCVLVKLEIPSYAKRINNCCSNKCRAEKAMVLDFIKIDENMTDSYFNKIKEKMTVTSPVSHNVCVYNIGKIVEADKFDEDSKHTCSNGIHFFLTEEDAMWYYKDEILH